MYPQKYRIICIVICAAFFLIAVSFFIVGFSKIETQPAFLKNFTPYGFLLISLSLLIVWQGAGLPGGFVFFVLSTPLIILVSYSLNSPIYNFQLIAMLGIAIPSHLFYKRGAEVLLEEGEKKGAIEEQQNLLSSQMAKDIALTQAFSRKLDRYNKLKELSETFNAKLSLDEIYKLTVEKAYEIIGKADEAKLFLATEDAQDLELCYSKGTLEKQNKFLKETDTFDKWVLNKEQPLIVSDATCDFRFDYQPIGGNLPSLSLIVLPLVIHQRTIGVLRLSNKKEGAFIEDDLRLLDFISDLASAAINNARLYIKTQELAITDGLTGLYVHRYFRERLSEKVNRCREKNCPLSLLMLDIDHFKDYNDRYGHAAGDKVLKGISDIISKDALKTSIVARYGGEEFVVLFPEEGKEKIASIADTIRKNIESTTFILRRQETKITVSIGVSTFPDDANSEEELLKKVDFLLYKAKKEGRNKVCAG